VSDFEDNYRKWHTKLSYTKSAARIIACFGAVIDPTDGLFILSFGFLIAELIGIVEEWV
jgi:hypothetical protein